MTIKADKILEQASRQPESRAPVRNIPDGSCPMAKTGVLGREAAATENFEPCDIEAKLPKARSFPRW